MGKAIVVSLTIVVVVFAAFLLIAWLRRLASKEKAADKGWALKGDLNRTQERTLIAHLDAAAFLLRDLATPPMDLSVHNTTLLSSEDRGRVETWLRDYNASAKGISNR
jgi:hypothetical protein